MKIEQEFIMIYNTYSGEAKKGMGDNCSSLCKFRAVLGKPNKQNTYNTQSLVSKGVTIFPRDAINSIYATESTNTNMFSI